MGTLEKTITTERLEDLAKEWSNYAGCIIDITILGNEIIATGTEIGCFRLAYYLRQNDVRVEQAKNQSYWYCIYKFQERQEIRLTDMLEDELSRSAYNNFMFTAEEKNLIKQRLTYFLEMIDAFL